MPRTLTIEINEEADSAIRRLAAVEGCAPEEFVSNQLNRRYQNRFSQQLSTPSVLETPSEISDEKEAELQQFVHDLVKKVRREKLQSEVSP